MIHLDVQNMDIEEQYLNQYFSYCPIYKLPNLSRVALIFAISATCFDFFFPRCLLMQQYKRLLFFKKLSLLLFPSTILRKLGVLPVIILNNTFSFTALSNGFNIIFDRFIPLKVVFVFSYPCFL